MGRIKGDNSDLEETFKTVTQTQELCYSKVIRRGCCEMLIAYKNGLRLTIAELRKEAEVYSGCMHMYHAASDNIHLRNCYSVNRRPLSPAMNVLTTKRRREG